MATWVASKGNGDTTSKTGGWIKNLKGTFGLSFPFSGFHLISSLLPIKMRTGHSYIHPRKEKGKRALTSQVATLANAKCTLWEPFKKVSTVRGRRTSSARQSWIDLASSHYTVHLSCSNGLSEWGSFGLPALGHPVHGGQVQTCLLQRRHFPGQHLSHHQGHEELWLFQGVWDKVLFMTMQRQDGDSSLQGIGTWWSMSMPRTLNSESLAASAFTTHPLAMVTSWPTLLSGRHLTNHAF